ncbi:MAG: alpha/beta fold hydrolase [Promethearchaeota archaeon]
MIEKNTQNALIFIHGSGESSYVWKDQMSYLNLDYSLIALDLPSHAKSAEFEKLSLDLYVESIKGLVDHLHLKKVILVGHSLGGAIAQAYYFKYREDIASLILCATGVRLRVSPFIFNSIRDDYNEYLKTIPLGAFYRKTSKQIINDFLEEVSKIEAEVAYKDFSICNEFDVLNKINRVRVPCLIICGNADKLTPIKYSQYFKDKIENSILKLIKNAGHMVMLEKPEEVNMVIQEFIKQKRL